MIPRYSLPEMAAIWSEEHKLAVWKEVETLVVEAWAELGVAPLVAAATLRAAPAVDTAAWKEREKVTNHDVAAFVDLLAEVAAVPPAGPGQPGAGSFHVFLPLPRGQFLRRAEPVLADHAPQPGLGLERGAGRLAVAGRSGFQTPQYLAQVFKRKTGVTPGAFRRERGESG